MKIAIFVHIYCATFATLLEIWKVTRTPGERRPFLFFFTFFTQMY